ncbi:hypothetical protein TNCV_4960781 [Trichonephila clavipes]|uniref:Uncharacterized protein n=1 Tax=Trichonephila clavipes TaxID=2585209 RepID=A0A8X6SLP6_TRICX|nr:hypothetical protein TNCV_4960781 [Trichonephila clavipes]
MNTQDNILWQSQKFFRKKRSDVPSLNGAAITDKQKTNLLAASFQNNFTDNILKGEEETLGLCKTFQSTTSCAKHRRMSERGETDSRSIGSSDKFHATVVQRNIVNHQIR